MSALFSLFMKTQLSTSEKEMLKNTVLLKTGAGTGYDIYGQPEMIKFKMLLLMGNTVYECNDCLISSISKDAGDYSRLCTHGWETSVPSANSSATITINAANIKTHFDNRTMIDKFNYMYDNQKILVDNIIEVPLKTQVTEKIVEKVVEKIIYKEKKVPTFKEIFLEKYEIYKYLI